MTVAELIDRIMAAYPGATPEAMKTFTPVFYARLRKHEGDALEDAATAVLGSFKPKFDSKFPIPADFEAHLPSGMRHLPAENGERRAIEERSERRRRNIRAWMEGQGAKIKSARPYPVYCACLLMAQEYARYQNWHYLTAEQIELCERRALSSARTHMFGRPPESGAELENQFARVREAWAQPEQEAA